jgi:hypothetical protein
MAVAFKVADSSTRFTRYTSSSTTTKRYLERYYQVFGVWPRYEVTVQWDESTRQVLWGSKALKAFEVAMRMEGYKRHRPKVWKK